MHPLKDKENKRTQMEEVKIQELVDGSEPDGYVLGNAAGEARVETKDEMRREPSINSSGSKMLSVLACA